MSVLVLGACPALLWSRRSLDRLKRVSNRRKLSLSYHIHCSHPTIQTDSCGIPLKPTWSVNRLLQSYPTPAISPTTFKHLHELSALVPPNEGTPEHDELKQELEDLIKVVEAVRLAQFNGEVVPDGRVWADGTGIPLTAVNGEKGGVTGTQLLRHAACTAEGFYIVKLDKRTK